MLGSTLFLSIVLRFVFILYADRFVKKGRLNLKLLQQLYWPTWVVFVINGLVPFVPVLSGTFPWNTYRDQLCLGDLPDGENKTLSKIPHYLVFGFKMVLLTIYAVKIIHRVTRYVDGQCPGQKMSSIGKYQRNVMGLRETFFMFLILHCLGFIILGFRLIAKKMDKSNAFLVNLLCESLMFLFYIAVFIFASRKDVPTRKEASQNVIFNKSKVKVLQPRRDSDFYFSSQCPNQAELYLPKTLASQPKESAGLKKSLQLNITPPLRDSSRKWIDKTLSDNKIHPGGTTIVYHCSSKVGQNFKLPDRTFKTNQTKLKKDSMKGTKYIPHISSSKSSSVDFELQEFPDAIINFPSSPFHVFSVDNSDQMEPE